MEFVSDLQLQKKVEHIFRDKFSCIDKLQKDNETQKFQIQTLNKRVQELEKEVELLKIFQKRRYKKTVQDLLKTLRPEKSWSELIQQWQNKINQESLEQVFTKSTFLESFLTELKNMEKCLVFIKDTIEIPETLLPILCVKKETKTNVYIWDNEAEVWTILQYNHLRKLITLYIYQIRKCWIQWQEENKNELNGEKYNSYISKPVSILYNENYKHRMIQTLMSF